MGTSESKNRRSRLQPYYWFLLILVGVMVAYLYSGYPSSPKKTNWRDFKTNMLLRGDVAAIEVLNGERAEVYIKADSLYKQQYRDFVRKEGKPSAGPHYVFQIGTLETFDRRFDEVQAKFPDAGKVRVTYKKTIGWPGFLGWLFPVGLLLLWYFFFGRIFNVGGKGKTVMEFGKSKAHVYEKGRLSRITFKEVAGYEEAKAEVMEIVDFLKSPAHFTRIGAKIPKGILLVGPPGTGKTLMAKAVAGEAAVPFFSLSGSEFIELFVGVGASRVRDLFDRAKEKAPSIVFIDEIDTVGRVRGKAVSVQVNDERESTLNQLLAEMDGFEANTGVIVIAATNRADILDPALLRAGRFDRHVYLELPNRQERDAIFKVHLRPLSLNPDVSSNSLASQTPGFSGADIANVCNEAALIAARRKKECVEQGDFLDAIDRVTSGLEKKTRIITPPEKKIIAYHEAGHAIVSWILPSIDPLVKVSIIPRGKSLGGAWFLPEERQIIAKSTLVEQLSAVLAGRASEEIVFGEVSSGALDDLEKATKQAYTMVTRLGLSTKVGNLSFYDSTGASDSTFQKPYSEEMGALIDREVQQMIADAYDRAKTILRQNRARLDKLSALLLEKELVFSAEVREILGERAVHGENRPLIAGPVEQNHLPG